MLKTQELDICYKEYKEKFSQMEIVLGSGNLESAIILIGEAPGRDEVAQGKPFVGAAGKNLSEFLNFLELSREEIFITNAIKYRLGKVSPKSGRIVNRPAKQLDIDENRPYLLRELEIINPKIVVTLGNVPIRALIGEKNISIGAVHGRINQWDIGNQEVNIFPLYHPASIIYNHSLKEVYQEDLKNLKLYMRSMV